VSYLLLVTRREWCAVIVLRSIRNTEIIYVVWCVLYGVLVLYGVYDCRCRMCGWVMRASTAFMTSGQFKRRWMILVDRKLHCFEDPFTLNAEKGVMDLSQVTSVVRMHAESFTVNTKGDSWLIKWDTSEAKNIQDSWKRKFFKSLPPHISASLS
jgi:hypothetical protein